MAGRSTRRVTTVGALAAALTALAPGAVAAEEAAARPGPLFVTSDQCISCHSNMVDADGGELSIGYTWRASMMALSAKDPYWQAGVRREIADRPHAEIDRFTPEGQYLSTLDLPEGSFPCDIDYLDGYAVVGALHGPDREKGAPVYLLQGDRVVSEVWPKEELGLEGFQHIHNAVLRRIDGRFYIILQAWNPGDFAILEQVEE